MKPSASTENEASAPAPAPTTIKECVEKAKRAFALKKYEQAVDFYANALEIITAKQEDSSLEAADLYFSYGKALLENAISQSAVFGKELAGNEVSAEELEVLDSEEAEEIQVKDDFFVNEAGPIPSSSREEEIERQLAEVVNAIDAEENDDKELEDEEGADDGEPEDDFQAAWEAFEVARSLYEKQKETDDSVKLKLADTYIALGDVSLETEKLDQAITDYTIGTKLKDELLPLYSRQVAEAHYKLSIVLDLTSGCLGDAIEHTKQALESVEARLTELRQVLAAWTDTPVEQKAQGGVVNRKGKGKATVVLGEGLFGNELPPTKPKIESEIKDLEELREDIALKVEELETQPVELHQAAPALAEKSLDRELDALKTSKSAVVAPTVVNDLSSMVVKKKKLPDVGVSKENGSVAKRGAEDDVEERSNEKKMKLDPFS